MKEYVEEFKDELKRVDHLIYVSLKYTRTVDVLKNVVHRLVHSFEILIQGRLQEAFDEGRIFEIPQPAIHKCNEFVNLYPDNEDVQEFMDFYKFLRKLAKCEEYETINEFRRHVAFICEIDGERVEVNIDNATEYYKRSMKYMEVLIALVGSDDD